MWLRQHRKSQRIILDLHNLYSYFYKTRIRLMLRGEFKKLDNQDANQLFAAKAAEKKVAIVHLKQTHVILNIDNNDIEKISFSQYNIARVILETKDALVLTEENPDCSLRLPSEECVRIARDVFSKGLPESFEKMNQDQKNC